MTIGLLGGTFDPPHDGHLHISRVALRRLGLDALWWLVTPGNPLKDRDDHAPFAARFARAQALARHPRITVTGFEARRPSAFTSGTIAFLRRRYPGTRFIWVMGADNLAGLHRWGRWREMVRMVPVAVVDRPGYRMAACAGRAVHVFASARIDESDAAGLGAVAPPAWTLLSAPLVELSSTRLRAVAGE